MHYKASKNGVSRATSVDLSRRASLSPSGEKCPRRCRSSQWQQAESSLSPLYTRAYEKGIASGHNASPQWVLLYEKGHGELVLLFMDYMCAGKPVKFTYPREALSKGTLRGVRITALRLDACFRPERPDNRAVFR